MCDRVGRGEKVCGDEEGRSRHCIFIGMVGRWILSISLSFSVSLSTYALIIQHASAYDRMIPVLDGPQGRMMKPSLVPALPLRAVFGSIATARAI